MSNWCGKGSIQLGYEVMIKILCTVISNQVDHDLVVKATEDRRKVLIEFVQDILVWEVSLYSYEAMV